MSTPGTKVYQTWRQANGALEPRPDHIAIEEPLEIRLETEADSASKALSVTMRTPGRDADLALGFLVGEGLISTAAQVQNVSDRPNQCPRGQSLCGGSVLVRLSSDVSIDWSRFERRSFMASSCGVCGKTAIAHLLQSTAFPLPAPSPVLAEATLRQLPAALRLEQSLFRESGAIHAAAVFDSQGAMIALGEDVGRHNAVDKAVGQLLRSRALPAHDSILLVSGRTSFEIVQKAIMAGVGTLAAIGAPSSLAVELAEKSRLTLIGFLSDARFNIYSHPGRIQISQTHAHEKALRPTARNV